MKDSNRIIQLEERIRLLESQNHLLKETLEKEKKPIQFPENLSENTESEARYKALADAASEAVFIMENGFCIDLNKKAIEIFGYSRKEALGLPILHLIAPQSKALVNEKFSLEYAAPYEGWCLRKTGEIFPAELRGKDFTYLGKKVRISTFRDISKQKQAELQLAKSEAKFRAYFEKSTAINLQIDSENFQILDANQAAIKFYGYSKAELLNMKIHDLNMLSKEEIKEITNKIRNKEQSDFSIAHRLKNGEIRYVQVHSSAIEVDGKLSLFSSIQDITEGKKAQEELKSSEARFRAYFENNTAAMLQIDPLTKRVIEANDAAIHFYGYSHEEFIKLNAYDINILPRHEIDQKMKQVMRSSSQAFVFQHRLANGESREVEVNVSPIVIATDQQLFITVYDVSEREKNKRSLQENARKLSEAQKIAKMGHFEFDLQTKAADWSDEVCRIFGFDKSIKNPSYQKYRNQIHPKDLAYQDAEFKKALEEKKEYQIVYRIYTLDGQLKYIEEKGFFELDENKEPIKLIGTLQDITTSYLIKKDLEESKAQLAIINKTLKEKVQKELAKSREKDHLLIQQSRHAVLGEMIGNIAHQWRQPLNEVSILVNDLEDAFTFGVLNKEYFEKTMKTVYRRLKFMSNTIDDFSKMYTDDFKKETFSPKELIEKLIKFIGGTTKRNKIQVRFMYDEDFEAVGYPNMLSHVMLNLLNNSRDILVEREIKKPEIWIKLKKYEHSYCIRVLDNGKGIDGEIVNRIFDPYFTTKTTKKGSGLGLFMAKSMVEKQMDGRIEIQNQLEGAEFKITLNLRID
ncbi:MAG: PAS domain S-box protein [Bacteroidales bacterium]|nr:PAS domain S-box protein [Bacteroidales bacterium]